MKLFKNFKQENKKGVSIDEEIDYKIESAIKKAKISRIKKYLPIEIEIDPFPHEQKKLRKGMENEIKEDENSEETQCTYKDSINLMKNLELDIKEFLKKNKSIIEKKRN